MIVFRVTIRIIRVSGVIRVELLGLVYRVLVLLALL